MKRDAARNGVRSDVIITQHVIKRGIVVLEGDDVIRLEKVKIDVRRSMDIDIWLKAFDSDGLVFYWARLKETGNGSNARKQYMKGDFIALLLIASQPHFFWNLGSGIAYVKAPATLSNHRFHSIRFTRNLRNGTIQVDYSPFISHQISLPKNNHLDVFGEDIYIGGVPNDHLIPPVIPEMRKRFKGVIQRISINGQIFNNLFKVIIHYV
ncbi:unnamed protein product [Anisakis simplex]|uniref:LAM_G_DOMAIN domain-containing protein n=1 Tax=Anisakis simplex TaxID=6269 RepID=A0A0M3J1F3_ANISI|nr:unnamed protein product [Anisakis simplex]